AITRTHPLKCSCTMGGQDGCVCHLITLDQAHQSLIHRWIATLLWQTTPWTRQKHICQLHESSRAPPISQDCFSKILLPKTLTLDVLGFHAITSNVRSVVRIRCATRIIHKK